MNFQRLMILGAVCGSLTACAGNRPVERALYDLHGIDPTPGSLAAVAIRLDVRMAAWFDNTEIAYRLPDDAPTRLRQYAESRWAAKASLLVAERLQALLGPLASAAKCTARVEISEFSQTFESASRSRFVLDARWSIANVKGERLSAEVRSLVVDALSADARGGVLAADKATGQLGVAIRDGALAFAECQ